MVQGDGKILIRGQNMQKLNGYNLKVCGCNYTTQ